MADYNIQVRVRSTQAVRALRQVDRGLRTTENSADRLRNSMRLVGGAIAVVATGAVIRNITQLSDKFTELRNAVAIAENSLGEMNGAQERLIAIANSARVGVGDLATVFRRTAFAASDLGASQEQLFAVTRLAAEAVAAQGGSMDSARGALLQLSQAFGSGTVRAEEFNSIMEGALPIAQAAARGIDEAGGSVAKLRSLVIAGEVDSRTFFNALLSQTEEVNAIFQTTTPTFAQAFEVLENGFGSVVNAFSGSTTAASTFIVEIGRALTVASQFNLDNIPAGPVRDMLVSVGDAANFVGEAWVISTRVVVGALLQLNRVSSGVREALGQAFFDVANALPAPFIDAFNTIQDGLEFAVNAYIETLNLLPGVTIDAVNFDNITSLVPEGFDAGRTLGQAFTDGYQGAIDVETAIADAARAVFNPSSTSAVSNPGQLTNTAAGVGGNATFSLQGAGPAATAAAANVATESITRLTDAERFRNRVLEDARGPQEELLRTQQVLNELFADGELTAQQYGDAMREVNLSLLDISTSSAAGVERAIIRMNEQFNDFGTQSEELITNSFRGMEDALVEFTTSGKLNFSDMADSIVSDLSRIAIRQSIIQPLSNSLFGGSGGGSGGGLLGSFFGGGGGGSILGGLGSSLFGSFPGFAQGGSFTVGGAGGTDSQMVAFRATPGESVTVDTPGSSTGRSGGGDTIIVNIQTQDAQSFRQSSSQSIANFAEQLSRAKKRNT